MPPDDLTPEEAAELDGTPFSTIAALRAAQAAIRLQVWREFFVTRCGYEIRSLTPTALSTPRGIRPLLRVSAIHGHMQVDVMGEHNVDARHIVLGAIEAYKTLVRSGELVDK